MILVKNSVSAASQSLKADDQAQRDYRLNVNPFREVRLRLPGGLFGDNPRGLVGHLGLRGRPLGDDYWMVRPTDDNRLIRSFDLADETGLAHRFDRLCNAPLPADSYEIDQEAAARFTELQNQLLERLKANDHSALFHLIQSSIVKAHSNREDLTAPVRDGYAGIGQIPMGETGEPAFPNRSASLVVATDLLLRRVRLPGIMLRFDQDPDALQILTGEQKQSVMGRMFASSADWYQEIIGVVHYLGPLLGCISPRFWCLPTALPPSAILFNLGMDLNGFRQSPMELMQLIPREQETRRFRPSS